MLVRWRRMALLGVVVLLVAVVAVGCGKKSEEKLAEGLMEKTLEGATGGDADVDLGGGDVTIKTQEGTTTISETSEWPGDMFDGVPKFTYGKVTNVTRVDQTQSGQKTVSVHLSELEGGGAEKYAKELEAAGWDMQVVMSAGEGGMINAQKGDLGLALMYNTTEKHAVLSVLKGLDE